MFVEGWCRMKKPRGSVIAAGVRVTGYTFPEVI
jgi:hypothetical protein